MDEMADTVAVVRKQLFAQFEKNENTNFNVYFTSSHSSLFFYVRFVFVLENERKEHADNDDFLARTKLNFGRAFERRKIFALNGC